MIIEDNRNLKYLIDQIRSNLYGNELMKETPRAHAWLLTTLAIYGNQLNVLIDLYRLFREENSYILLSFIIEHIFQYHQNEIEKTDYLEKEFQLIYHSNFYSLLSSITRERISSLLIKIYSNELEKNLLLSTKSMERFHQCREKALICLTLSSPSILQLIINTENQIGFNIKSTSLNILRCLFVEDLLPIVLENRQKLDIQSHICHKWMMYAIEFYLEYWIKSLKIPNKKILLEGSNEKIFQCENPLEQIEKLMNLAINIQQNFNWQQFLIHQGNRRQKLLELRILIDRSHHSTIRCPLECYIFCTSFPIYIQSIIELSFLLNNKDYIFIYSTSSIKKFIQEFNQFDLIENFYLFIECLSLVQQSEITSCLKLYQEMIEKIQLNTNIQIYQRLIKIFYFYYIIQKIQNPINKNKTIIIDDTPQSPTMQDESNLPNPLICPDIETFIEQLNDNSLESRLQLCSLYSLSQQSHLTVSFSIETLIYLHENYLSSNPEQILLTISSDYSFIPCSYPMIFDYIFDIILQYLPSTLILLQIQQQYFSSYIYPKNLFHTLSPLSLRYIYDQKLLGQLLKYIQTTTTNDRRWIGNKRKFDEDEKKKLNDEEFIEKIIQHVSNITQWDDEQRRHAIYSYIIDERQTLLQSL